MSLEEEIEENKEPYSLKLPRGYHEPKVDSSKKWKGKSWHDMQGNDEVEKKLNFSLYRRNLLKTDKDNG